MYLYVLCRVIGNLVIGFCQPRNMIECQFFHDITFVILPTLIVQFASQKIFGKNHETNRSVKHNWKTSTNIWLQQCSHARYFYQGFLPILVIFRKDSLFFWMLAKANKFSGHFFSIITQIIISHYIKSLIFVQNSKILILQFWSISACQP